jgi:cullin 4
MVQRLLDFKAYIDSVVASAFTDTPDVIDLTSDDDAAGSDANAASSNTLPTRRPNQDFIYARNDAFQMGFRARRYKPAEMIAKYLDKAMRKGQQGAPDEVFGALLDSALALYRFTEDKDVFRTFYHRALAKRLLLEKSASNDFEKAMLKKLKERE